MNYIAVTAAVVGVGSAVAATMSGPDVNCVAAPEVARYYAVPEVKLIRPTDWEWPVTARFDAPSYKEPTCSAPEPVAARDEPEDRPRARRRYKHRWRR